MPSQKKHMLPYFVGLSALVIVAVYLSLNYFGNTIIHIQDANVTDWKTVLTAEQYHVMREAGTEKPFSSPLNDEKRTGTFYDATGTQALFRSEDKFDSGTGWPSFTKPITPDAIIEKTDYKLGFPRTEILSSKDGHHLGHKFTDGPEPTGLRYCMNGTALKFVPDEK